MVKVESRVLRQTVCLALAILFTIGGIQMSEWRGPLAAVPNYDDAVYFLSATRLIEAGRADGLGGVAEELRSEGLHSPWSVGVAVAAFLTFGYVDWAPYALNFFVVLGLLVALSWMWRALRWWEWGSGLVVFLALPFAAMAVVQFRPDLAWAVAVGFCGVYGLTVPGYFERMGPRLIHAVICAVALLVKPSTFAMTGIVFAYSVGGRVLLESVAAGRIDWRAIWRTAWVQTVVVIGLTAVYAVPFGAETWHYFFTNSFGANEEIWRAPGSVVEKWAYYGVGFGAANNLGWVGWILVGVIGVGVFSHAEGRDERERARQPRRRREGEPLTWLALGGLLVVTYALSSGFGMKSPFLGGAFFGCFVFTAAFGWSEVFEFRISNLSKVVAPGLAVVALLIWQWPPYAWSQAGEVGRNFSEVERQVIDVIDDLDLPEDVNLLFSQSGPLMRENVEMWLLRNGHRTEAVKGGFLKTVKRFENKRRQADVVFVQDAGMRDSFANLPAEGLMPELVESMRGAADFSLAGEAVGGDGKKVYVYQRTVGR